MCTRSRGLWRINTGARWALGANILECCTATGTAPSGKNRLLKQGLRLVVGWLGVGQVLVSEAAEFAANRIGGKAGTKERAVERGDFLFVEVFLCEGAAE